MARCVIQPTTHIGSQALMWRKELTSSLASDFYTRTTPHAHTRTHNAMKSLREKEQCVKMTLIIVGVQLCFKVLFSKTIQPPTRYFKTQINKRPLCYKLSLTPFWHFQQADKPLCLFSSNTNQAKKQFLHLFDSMSQDTAGVKVSH